MEEHVMDGDSRAAVTQHNPHVSCGPRCSCDFRPDGLRKTSEDRKREEREWFAELRAGVRAKGVA